MAFTQQDVDLSKVIVEEEFNYGDHELQKLTVYHHFGTDSQKDGGYWIIYIHGGAWRDPTISDKSFLPTIRQCYSNPMHRGLVNEYVSAFASVSYRLSPHPSFPQDPETPATRIREAKHPDHLEDVTASVAFLQSKYGFGSRYLLVGHSCGATLAFQSIMQKTTLLSRLGSFQSPEIIVGVAGIYDLRLLRDTHSHPAYQSFLEGAFGSDEKTWDIASPAKSNSLGKGWREGKLIVLASSSGDELVDNLQIESMADQVKNMDGAVTANVLKDWLSQGHDDIWLDGVGLADVISETLKILLKAVK